MRHTLTLALASTIASLAGVNALTVEYASDRTAPDAKDGNARNAVARTLCATLAKGDKGRELLTLASQGSAPAILALTLATPEAWKDASKAGEAIRSALADTSKGWPVAIPRMAQHASRALEAWQDAEAARMAKDAKAAKASTPAPAARPTLAKGFPTLDTIKAHMAQDGTSYTGKPAAWKGKAVA